MEPVVRRYKDSVGQTHRDRRWGHCATFGVKIRENFFHYVIELIEIPSRPIFDEDFENDVHFFQNFIVTRKKWPQIYPLKLLVIYCGTEPSTDYSANIKNLLIFWYYHDLYYWWLYRLNSSQLLQPFFKNEIFATNFGYKVTRFGIKNRCGHISIVLSMWIIISVDINMFIFLNYDKNLEKNGRHFQNPHQKLA